MNDPLPPAIRAVAYLLVMFVDGVGISLVLPLISDLFSTTSPHSIIGADVPPPSQSVLYGATSFAMIFGTTALGQLSDRIGRTRTLRLALAGNMAGYLLCGAAGRKQRKAVPQQA